MAWETKLDNPRPRRGVQGFPSVNGLMYYVGGNISIDEVSWSTYYWSNDCDQYDPVTDTWTAKASLPYYMDQHFVTADADAVYVSLGARASTSGPVTSNVGGRWNPDTFRYDPVANSWSTIYNSTGIAAAGIGTNSGFAVMINGLIYVIAYTYSGGWGTYPIVIDPLAATWTYGAMIGTINVSNGSVGDVLDGLVYIALSPQDHVSWNPVTNKVTSLAALPFPVYVSPDPDAYWHGMTYTAMAQTLCLLGVDTNTYSTVFWAYDPNLDTWTRLDDPVYKFGHTAGYNDTTHSLVVTGGVDNSDNALADPVTQAYGMVVQVDGGTVTMMGRGRFALYPDVAVVMKGRGLFHATSSHLVRGYEMVPGTRAAGNPLSPPPEPTPLPDPVEVDPPWPHG